MDMSLDAFAPTPCILRVGGCDLTILPLKMRQIPPFSRAVKLVAPYLLADQMLLAVQDQYDSLRDAVAIAAQVEVEWLGDLYPDDFILLAAAVVEVNADFFARRVLPAIRTASEAVTRAISAAREAVAGGMAEGTTGQPSLPGSPSGDTGLMPAST